jgi:hypothetical protein
MAYDRDEERGMNDVFSWESPSSRLVLNGVLDILAELGYDGLTAAEVRVRAAAAGPALRDFPDLEALAVAALGHVELFPPPTPTGDLRQDLRSLLQPWREAPSRDERVIAAVLSAAMWRPRLRVALHDALDRPLTHAVAVVVARSSASGAIPPAAIQTLCWVLRGLIVDRLRSGPRSSIDLDLLVDFLVAGLKIEPGTPTNDAAQPQSDPSVAAPA